MSDWIKRLGWVALGLAVIIATTIALYVFVTSRINETNGLMLVNSWKFSYPQSPSDPRDPWQTLIATTPTVELKQNPKVEMIRFIYQPSFNPNVCITVWKDGEECWIRSTVCKQDVKQDEVLFSQQNSLWQKTKPLSLSKWNDLRTRLLRKSVADPLSGAAPSAGLDGSAWVLESAIAGKTTSAEVDNPVVSKGVRGFQFIEPQSTTIADFVDTCRYLLKLGEVRVPEMF